MHISTDRKVQITFSTVDLITRLFYFFPEAIRGKIEWKPTHDGKGFIFLFKGDASDEVVRLFEEARNGKHAPPVAREKPAPVAGTKVWDMEKPSLSVRALNILKSCEIENIEQLSACTRNDLLRKRHMGPVTLKEIEAFLKAHGSHLAE